jgi:hypothetical protein
MPVHKIGALGLPRIDPAIRSSSIDVDRVRSNPGACIASGEFRMANVVRRFPALCGGIFRMQQKDLALQSATAQRGGPHGATRG